MKEVYIFTRCIWKVTYSWQIYILHKISKYSPSNTLEYNIFGTTFSLIRKEVKSFVVNLK